MSDRAISSPTRAAAAVMMSRLPEYAGRKSPAPSTSTKTATRPRSSAGCRLELGWLEEPVARDVRLHLGHHRLDRRGHRVGVGVGFERAEDGVPHRQRRVSGIEDDDGLAALGAAEHLDRGGGRAGELVDVAPGAGSGGAGGDGGHDLRVGDAGHPRHGVDHRDGRLPPAGHEVDVRLVEVAVEVHRWDHIGTTRRRGQVDRPDARLLVARSIAAVHVSRRRLEDDVGALGPCEQPVHSLGGRLQAEIPSASQTFAVGVDPDDVAHLERVGPQQLVDEVGADVPGPHDGSSRARAHDVDPGQRSGAVHLAVPESGTAEPTVGTVRITRRQ